MPPQPLEFRKIGAGITDNFIPGEDSGFAKICNNLDITDDLQLDQRPGSDIYSATAYQLTDGNHRVSKLINFDSDSELIALQGQKVNYIAAGAWSSLLGPVSSHDPFHANDYTTQVSDAQWQKHIFMVSESGDKPIKIYRDGSANLQIRTAGMPKFDGTTLSPVDGGLASAIVLANAIRTKMIAHFNDSSSTPVLGTATVSHKTDSGLTTEYNNVNGSTVASDLASLITLVNLLRTNHDLHVVDILRSPSTAPSYHITTGYDGIGPGEFNEITESPVLNYNVTVHPSGSIPGAATIADVLPYLNDLRAKWNYHSFALNTHYNAFRKNAGTGSVHQDYYGLHYVSTSEISTYTGFLISPDIATFTTYVKDMYTDLLAHFASYAHHTQDTANHPVTGGNSNLNVSPTTLHDGVILLAYTAYAFYRHFADANLLLSRGVSVASAGYTASPKTYYAFNGVSTSGSNQLASIGSDPTGTFGTTPSTTPGDYNYFIIIPRYYLSMWITSIMPFVTNEPLTGSSDYLKPAHITASAASPNTITLSQNSTHTIAAADYYFSTSNFHWGPDSNQTAITHFSLRNFFDSILFPLNTTTSLTALGTVAGSISSLIKAHTLNNHVVTSPAQYEYDSGTNYKHTLYLFTPGAGETTFPSHYRQSGGTGLVANPGYNHFPEIFAETRFDSSPAGRSSLYQILYRFDYTVGPVTYSDFGTPSPSQQVIEFDSPAVTTANTARTDATAISNIPVLANATADNYDTGTIVKEIYRTTNGGTVLYKVGSIANSATSYSDVTLDISLISNAQIYTTGGVAFNDPPPIAKYIHIFNNVAYYANVTESGVAATYRLRQSIASDPDSCPEDFFLDFDQTILGINSTTSNLVIFCSASTHRVTGIFDELGRGGMTREAISDTIGCVNNASIVRTDMGLFWAGQYGFYYTDGFKVIYLTHHFESTYLSYTGSAAQKAAIVGTFDKQRRIIYWSIQSTSGGSPDLIVGMNLNQGLKEEMPLNTWSGSTGFAPTALAFFQSQIIRGTSNGYIFKHDPSYYMDWKVDTAVSPTLWSRATIMWDYKGCDQDFGTTYVRKYLTRITPQFKFVTNLSAGISIDLDRGKSVSLLTPIRSRKITDWGDANVSPPAGFVASTAGVVDEFRRLSGTYLRCDYASFEFKNGYVVITSSDVVATCTTADAGGGNFTATLGAGKKWPNYSVDYYLRVGGMDYLVITRTSDTVIVCTGAPAFAAGVKWELWGYPKNEKAHIIGYSVRYNLMGGTQKDFAGATSTDGGQNV